MDWMAACALAGLSKLTKPEDRKQGRRYGAREGTEGKEEVERETERTAG